jgi:CDP-glucose 4,6-dehydratase
MPDYSENRDSRPHDRGMSAASQAEQKVVMTAPNLAFRGRRVLVTGHAGFKGGWLVAWLRQLGAIVSGLGLPPRTRPNLFEQAAIADGIEHRIGDTRDADLVTQTFADLEPEIVFHLAA